MTKAPTTVVRLSRAIESDGRMVDSIAFAGAPGSEPLPVAERDGEFEIDALAVLSVIARRTGVSRPAIQRLEPIDFMAVTLAMFLPPRRKPVALKKGK